MVASFLHSDKTSWWCFAWWKRDAAFLYLFLSSSSFSLGLRFDSVAESSVSAEVSLDLGGKSGAEGSG